MELLTDLVLLVNPFDDLMWMYEKLELDGSSSFFLLYRQKDYWVILGSQGRREVHHQALEIDLHGFP